MSDKILTAEIVREIIADWKEYPPPLPPDQELGPYFYLDEYTAIEEAAARELVSATSSIFLGGMTSLTSEVAGVLAGCEGELALLNVATLSDEAASALSEFKGRSLDLHRLEELTASAGHIKLASRLAGQEDAEAPLELLGLHTLCREPARYLAGSVSRLLLLSSLDELSPDVAAELTAYKGCLLLPGRVLEIDGIAEVLGQSEARKLIFVGEFSLSTSAAAAISKFWGGLSFGLTSIEADVAEVLSKCQGHLTLRNLDLRIVHDDVIQHLLSHQKLGLTTNLPFVPNNDGLMAYLMESGWKSTNVTTLDVDGARRLVHFSQAGSMLDLSAVKEVTSEDVLWTLAEWTGDISLGFRDLDANFAACISLFKVKTLDLRAIPQLSCDAVSSFRHFEGHLRVRLTAIPEAMHSELLTYPCTQEWGRVECSAIAITCRCCGHREEIEKPHYIIERHFPRDFPIGWPGWNGSVCQDCRDREEESFWSRGDDF